MKFKSTWILLAVFATLGAYLYFAEAPSKRAGEPSEKGVLFPDLDVSKAREVVLLQRGAETRLEKGDSGGWRLTAPFEDRADDARVNGLLSDLKGFRADREVSGPEPDLKTFGLDAPEGAIAVNGADDSLVTLTIGAENPAGDARYVRAGAGPVHVAKSYALETFLAEPDEFRSRDILGDLPWARLSGVEVRSPGRAPLRLSRADGRWRLEEPIRSEADPEAASELAEKLRWTRITSFAASDAAKAASAFGRGVTVSFVAEGESAPSVVRLAWVDGSVWAERVGRNALFILEEDAYRAFQVTAEDLQRKKPVLARSWNLNRVDLLAGSQRRLYEKVESAWRRGGRPLPDEEKQLLEDYLKALEFTRALHVLREPAGPASYGLDGPALAAKIVDAQHGEQAYWVGEKAGRVYARSAEPTVYEMSPEYLSKALALFERPGRRASPGEGPSDPPRPERQD
jgi:hypothetical protein